MNKFETKKIPHNQHKTDLRTKTAPRNQTQNSFSQEKNACCCFLSNRDVWCVFLGLLVTTLINGRLEVLLVLSNQVNHVALGLSELHLIHTLSGVPVQEGLALEHG